VTSCCGLSEITAASIVERGKSTSESLHHEPIRSKHVAAIVLLAAILPLTACNRADAPETEESVLRVHDVSDLQVQELDDKLNELLSRADLPLRGKVELIDDNRLAVNASRYLQDEIEAMIDQLRDDAPGDAIERPFRIEFWLLRMAPGEGSGDVPAYLADDLEPLLSQYDGYGLSVEDYLESFHTSQASINRISSGTANSISFQSAAASSSGIILRARFSSHSRGQGTINYEINHTLEPGKPLVLGRAHYGGGADKASYQILVARAEWADAAD